MKTVSEGQTLKVAVKKGTKTVYKTEHWSQAAKRHRQQKFLVRAYLNGKINDFKIPCRIKLTRVAPYTLDFSDNLPMSMKWILDSICDMIVPGLPAGRADSKGFKIEYDQKQGLPKEYAVEVEIENLEEKC